jgi:hypothetical protein
MTRRPLSPPPRTLSRAKLDNLALVPGSMLPYMEACQEAANRLPKGAVLIVLPQENEPQKQTMLLVAKLLATEGHQVAVIPAAELRRHQRA